MPKPTLAETCATLDRLLSGSSPMALMAAKDQIRDLVAGVADLDRRTSRLEAATSELAVAILRHDGAKDLHNVDELRELAGGDLEEFDKLLIERAR